MVYEFFLYVTMHFDRIPSILLTIETEACIGWASGEMTVKKANSSFEQVPIACLKA